MKRMRLAAFLAVVLLLSGCGAKEETTVDLTAFFDRLDQSYAWGETYFMEQDEEGSAGKAACGEGAADERGSQRICVCRI